MNLNNKNNIIKHGLFSVSLHGILLACCLAVPAQSLVPLFSAGNSALTLTSLSVYQPGAVTPDNSLTLQEKRRDPANNSPKETEPEIEKEEENDPDNFSIESRDVPADKLPAVPPQGNVKKANHRIEGKQPALFLNGDAQTKGIAGGLAANSGIHPYYPLGARLRGEEGVVKVEVHVGSSGRVLDCAVAKSSGYSALDEAALKAVQCARFISAKSLSIKNDNRTILTFRFDLVD